LLELLETANKNREHFLNQVKINSDVLAEFKEANEQKGKKDQLDK
jgi:hypothetical protein